MSQETTLDASTSADVATAAPTRRSFIGWWLSGLLAAFGAAIALPPLVYIIPPAPPGTRKGFFSINLDKPISELNDGEGVKFDAPQNVAFLMKDGGGDNAAGDLAFSGYAVKLDGQVNVYATNCSHLGCPVKLASENQRFECPCHGSMFHLNGSVLHGPAQFPLSHLDWHAEGNGISVRGTTLGKS